MSRSARRLRRSRRDLPPPCPPGLDRIRRARHAVDPAKVYSMAFPDGSMMAVPGFALLETADAFVALADAVRAGDKAGARAALDRIEAPAAAVVLCTRVGSAPFVPPGAELETCEVCGEAVWVCAETRSRVSRFQLHFLCSHCVGSPQS